MPWPTQVWDPQNPNADDMGMVPFQVMEPGEAYLRRKGLEPQVFYERPNIKDPELSVWDAMESPFFKAMYERKPGRNWDNFKAAFDREIGAYEDQEFRLMTREGTSGGRVRTGRNSYETMDGTPPEYQYFDGYQAAWDYVHSSPRNDFGIEYNFSVDDIELAAQPTGEFDPHTDDDDYRFWGINDSAWESIFNEMVGEGYRIQKRWELQEAPIIREGPKASDYGIIAENDNIYTYYGLDKPAAEPKELQWNNYQWNLRHTVTSKATYAVPPGLRRVNLHEDIEFDVDRVDRFHPRSSLKDKVQTTRDPDNVEWQWDNIAEASGEEIN